MHTEQAKPIQSCVSGYTIAYCCFYIVLNCHQHYHITLNLQNHQINLYNSESEVPIDKHLTFITVVLRESATFIKKKKKTFSCSLHSGVGYIYNGCTTTVIMKLFIFIQVSKRGLSRKTTVAKMRLLSTPLKNCDLQL